MPMEHGRQQEAKFLPASKYQLSNGGRSLQLSGSVPGNGDIKMIKSFWRTHSPAGKIDTYNNG